MNTKTLALVVLVVVLIAGGFLYTQRQSRSMMEPKDAMMEKSEFQTTPASDASGDAMVKADDAMTHASSRYVPYSKEAYDAAQDKKRVLYFHAPWCPTCRPTDKEFEAQKDSIPEDIVLFKTDYDTSTELKSKYAITYQHTFVQVDKDGNLVTKWSGGGLTQLIDNVQ